jgi:hypothetical protein
VGGAGAIEGGSGLVGTNRGVLSGAGRGWLGRELVGEKLRICFRRDEAMRPQPSRSATGVRVVRTRVVVIPQCASHATGLGRGTTRAGEPCGGLASAPGGTLPRRGAPDGLAALPADGDGLFLLAPVVAAGPRSQPRWTPLGFGVRARATASPVRPRGWRRGVPGTTARLAASASRYDREAGGDPSQTLSAHAHPVRLTAAERRARPTAPIQRAFVVRRRHRA